LLFAAGVAAEDRFGGGAQAAAARPLLLLARPLGSAASAAALLVLGVLVAALAILGGVGHRSRIIAERVPSCDTLPLHAHPAGRPRSAPGSPARNRPPPAPGRPGARRRPAPGRHPGRAPGPDRADGLRADRLDQRRRARPPPDPRQPLRRLPP